MNDPNVWISTMGRQLYVDILYIFSAKIVIIDNVHIRHFWISWEQIDCQINTVTFIIRYGRYSEANKAHKLAERLPKPCMHHQLEYIMNDPNVWISTMGRQLYVDLLYIFSAKIVIIDNVHIWHFWISWEQIDCQINTVTFIIRYGRYCDANEAHQLAEHLPNLHNGATVICTIVHIFRKDCYL